LLGCLWLVLVKFHEFSKIELWFLKHFHLSDEDVLEGEDLLALLGDGLVDLVSEQLLEEVFEGALGGLSNED